MEKANYKLQFVVSSAKKKLFCSTELVDEVKVAGLCKAYIWGQVGDESVFNFIINRNLLTCKRVVYQIFDFPSSENYDG